MDLFALGKIESDLILELEKKNNKNRDKIIMLLEYVRRIIKLMQKYV